MRQRPLEAHDIRVAGALLRREHPGSPVRTQQRAANVARDVDRAVREAPHDGRDVDRRDVLEPRATGCDLPSTRISHASAEGLEQSGAAIGAGTAADPHDDAPRSGFECDPDELSGATRRGVERVESIEVDTPEPGGFGELNHRLFAVPTTPAAQ